MILLLLLTVLWLGIILLVQHYRTKMRPIMEKAEKIPGPKTLPLIGNALQFGRGTKEFFDYIVWLIETHGPIARVWIGPILAVVLADPKYIEVVMGSSKCNDKAMLYKFGEPWLGQGLITGKGSIWKRHRKIITPAFHVKILDKFVHIYNSNTDILLDRLEKHVNGPDFDIYPYMNFIALDIICESAMGVKINAQIDSNSEYVTAVESLGDAMFIRAFKPWLHLDLIFNLSSLGRLQKRCLKVLHGMTDHVIKQRKEKLYENNNKDEEEEQQQPIVDDEDDSAEIGLKQRYAFLDLLLQAVKDGATLTDREVQEEVDTIMLAGHDTTTSALSYACWLLSKHQDIQEKAMQEMREIFGDSDRAATFRDLQEMKYLEQILKETLRLYPSVPIYGRLITEDVPLGDGYVLPAGCNVGFSPFMLHRNPEYYPDPEKFDPDRFLPENCLGRHPYCYIPFSGGPRICLGMKFAMLEMKAVLSALLRRFQIVSGDPNHKLELTVVMVLKCTTGIPIRLVPREKNTA